MSVIQIKNLSYIYDSSTEKIFDNVTLNLDTSWKTGVIGRNGKGKTTFLNLLLGKITNYQGNIIKSVECSYFPFNVKGENKITIDIVYELLPGVEDWEIMKELNLLNVDLNILYKEFKLLSGGEKVKVLLASLFLKENNFLLIDEPTNHLDVNAKQEVMNYLKQKSGFILVSHDRVLLDEVTDHIMSINNTNIEILKGNFSVWKENKENQDNFEMTKNEKLKKDITRLKIAAKNTSSWSDKVEKSKYNTSNSGSSIDRGYVGHKSAKMMKTSKVVESRVKKAIDEKSELLKNIDRNDSLTIKPLDTNKNKLIIAKDFEIKYNSKAIFKSINFELNKGDKIALAGENGTGKTSIVKLIMGEKIEINGEFKVANDLKISYVSQNTDDLKGTLKEYAKTYGVDEGIFKAMLSKMGMSKLEFEKDMSSFSEGQKKKVLIARSITQNSDIYVWDEPLNYIDILSRMQIEEAILKYNPTMIFIEHDETFIKNIATKIVKLEKV